GARSPRSNAGAASTFLTHAVSVNLSLAFSGDSGPGVMDRSPRVGGLESGGIAPQRRLVAGQRSQAGPCRSETVTERLTAQLPTDPRQQVGASPRDVGTAQVDPIVRVDFRPRPAPVVPRGDAQYLCGAERDSSVCHGGEVEPIVAPRPP